MEHILSALIPIFLLILIGYYFKRINFPSSDFWINADKLTYYILMPSLLIYKLSTANLEKLESLNFIFTTLICIIVILLFLVIINFKTNTLGASFSSVVQGGIRFNTYVFLALISVMFTDEGIGLAALLITFVIPLINVLCVMIFTIYVNENKFNTIILLKSIITNPLIVACCIGGSINYIDVSLPIIAVSLLKILSASALPMGLLSVGFALDLRSIKQAKFDLILSSFFKLVVTPICMFIIGKIFGLGNLLLSIVVIFAAMPTAPSSFILARQLKGDTKLMASIITFQTIVSIFSISLILTLIYY
ncbi:MAG: AEC family transporter [Arcobacter sp.]|nr:AEC family transporter [Arcobacter sp.]